MQNLQTFLFILQIVISTVIVIFVLLQQTDEDSLSGIGAGASQKMLSKRNTNTPISKATMIFFILFMLNSLLLATITARNANSVKVEMETFSEEQKKNEKPTLNDVKDGLKTITNTKK